jgi:hypothetical protein
MLRLIGKLLRFAFRTAKSALFFGITFVSLSLFVTRAVYVYNQAQTAFEQAQQVQQSVTNGYNEVKQKSMPFLAHFNDFWKF